MSDPRHYTPEEVMLAAFGWLQVAAKVDRQAAQWAAYDWLQDSESGLPYAALIDNNAREDARFWAETANPAELEAYALAAVDRLAGMSGGYAMFATRQMKRLAGALFRRMAPEEKAAFANWIQGQINE